jgi:hypothetical protein
MSEISAKQLIEGNMRCLQKEIELLKDGRTKVDYKYIGDEVKIRAWEKAGLEGLLNDLQDVVEND